MPYGPRCCRFAVEPVSRLQQSQHRYRGVLRVVVRGGFRVGSGAVSATVELARIGAELEQRKREVLAAKTADSALRWMEQYASSAITDTTFDVHFTCASKCVGADEAQEYLEQATASLIGEIYARAELLARTDLERVLPASAMSAGTAETTQIGSGLQPASAVAKRDAQ